MKHKKDYPVRFRAMAKRQGRESLARKRDAYDRMTRNDTNGLDRWNASDTNDLD